ncbi:MAG TPA: hypothetical protein VNA14_05300 [Mycobacteriales bacterium]|nr:hypothetical protein [Mycobacteriales bacterium]
MTVALGVLSLVLGTVYVGYGVITIVDLRRGWSEQGLSHFGLAWVCMAFTCGPHHLEHGLHLLLADRAGGGLELLAVAVGAPAGIIWFLLRVEATVGGRGDRFVSGTPAWLRALPWISAGYAVLMVGGLGATAVVRGVTWRSTLAPNLLLVVLYGLIGWYLLRTQLHNRGPLGGWSVSGLSLTAVFPTCAVMHGAWVVYALTGRYELEPHGMIIDWLAVPAAFYFLWVVRSLHMGAGGVGGWNEGSRGVLPDVAPALAVPPARGPAEYESAPL